MSYFWFTEIFGLLLSHACVVVFFLFIFYLSFLNIKIRRHFQKSYRQSHCDKITSRSLSIKSSLILSHRLNRLTILRIFICPSFTTGLCYKTDFQTPSLEILIQYDWVVVIEPHIYSSNNLSKWVGLLQQWMIDRCSETSN